MSRTLVVAAFLLVAALVVTISFWVGDTRTGDLLRNLGSEILGITITVAVVEWFFEKRRHQARGREMAWNALHGIQHAVWVWQGGPRQMDTADVLGLLAAVDEDDPLPDFTQALLLAIGIRSKHALDHDSEAVQAAPGLMRGLEELSRLASLKDDKPGSTFGFTPRKIADVLASGTEALARVLDLPRERQLSSLIRGRDPDIERQKERHFGVDPFASGGSQGGAFAGG